MRTYPVEARRHNAQRANVPLTDQQLQAFVANGFLVLKSSLPETYHRLIFERFDEVATGIGHFGNNLLPLIPELVEFFDDPVVKGALTSVLGRDYSMHPHRALHKNPPGSDEQQFHKDSYWGYTRRVRNHRPWWVMIMYFPQDTELEKGPTAVMAGSQHLNQRPEELLQRGADRGRCGFVRADPLRHLASQDEEPDGPQPVHVQVRVRAPVPARHAHGGETLAEARKLPDAGSLPRMAGDVGLAERSATPRQHHTKRTSRNSVPTTKRSASTRGMRSVATPRTSRRCSRPSTAIRTRTKTSGGTRTTGRSGARTPWSATPPTV